MKKFINRYWWAALFLISGTVLLEEGSYLRLGDVQANSIAQLKTYHPYDGLSIRTLAYSTSRPGGAARYIYSALTTGLGNDRDSIKPNTVGGMWLMQIENNTVSLQQLGIIPSIDNTIDLNTVMTWASTNQYTIIINRNSTYIVDPNAGGLVIHSNFNLAGEDYYTSVIKAKAYTTANKFLLGDTNLTVRNHNVTIKNLTLDDNTIYSVPNISGSSSNKDSLSSIVSLSAVDTFMVDKVRHVNGGSYVAFFYFRCTYGVLQNSYFDHTGGGFSGGYDTANYKCSVINCEFHYPGCFDRWDATKSNDREGATWGTGSGRFSKYNNNRIYNENNLLSFGFEGHFIGPIEYNDNVTDCGGGIYGGVTISGDFTNNKPCPKFEMLRNKVFNTKLRPLTARDSMNGQQKFFSASTNYAEINLADSGKIMFNDIPLFQLSLTNTCRNIDIMHNSFDNSLIQSNYPITGTGSEKMFNFAADSRAPAFIDTASDINFEYNALKISATGMWITSTLGKMYAERVHCNYNDITLNGGALGEIKKGYGSAFYKDFECNYNHIYGTSGFYYFFTTDTTVRATPSTIQFKYNDAGTSNLDSVINLVNPTGVPVFFDREGTIFQGGNVYTAATSTIDVAKRYNVVADNSTDNSTSLTKLRTDIAGSKTAYTLIFPEGTVLGDNRWIYGILNARIVGAGRGTTFRTIYSGSDEKFQRPLWNGDFFQTNVLTYTGGITFTTNYRFGTSTAGQLTIPMRTIADATNFSAGDKVILWGFEQAGTGYPPGTRYNEWHTISSVNTGTGVITFKEALINDWDSTWWDVPNQITTGSNSGKPRITKINNYPTYLEFNNITFGAPSGGGSSASGSAAISADHVVYNNVTVEGNFWPGMVRLIECNNVRCIGNPANGFIGEADKMGGTLIIKNSYFRIPLTNGTGFENINIDNSVFDESVGICSRNVTLTNLTIRGNLYPSASTSPLTNAPASNPIRNYTVENITFTKTASNTAPNAFQLPGLQHATIAAVVGDSIYFPWTSFTATNANQVYTMEKGTTYMAKNDGSKRGLVTNVTFDSAYNSGQGAFVVFGKWGTPPVVGEVWYWNTVGNFIDKGPIRNLGNYEPLFSETSVMQQGSSTKGIIKTITLTTKSFSSAGADNQVDIYGTIIDIDCYVKKAFNGTDASCTIGINDASYGSIFTVNAKTTGRRFLNQFAASGSVSGDNLDNTKLGIFQTQLHLLFRGPSSANLVDQRPQKMPEIEWVIRYIPL